MQRRVHYVAALSLLLASMQFAGTAAFAQKYVQGGIEHKEKVAPVESKFLPGSVWKEGGTDGTKSTWIRIPEWLAGTWFADMETATSRQDLVSHKESATPPLLSRLKSRFSYGTQRDGRGGIWH